MWRAAIVCLTMLIRNLRVGMVENVGDAGCMAQQTKAARRKAQRGVKTMPMERNNLSHA